MHLTEFTFDKLGMIYCGSSRYIRSTIQHK